MDRSEIAQPTLVQMALGDADAEVRRAALSQIDDWRLLANLAQPDLDPVIVNDLVERTEALQLHELFAAQGVEAKLRAMDLIRKDSMLAMVAETETEADVRLAAVERISAPETLAELVTKNCGKAPALLAVDKISDESLLRQIATNAASRAARARALQKVAAIEEERNRPTPEALREMELASLVNQAQRCTEFTNFAVALDACLQLQERWRQLAPPDEPRTPELDAYCDLIRSRRQEELARHEAKLAAQRAHEEHLERLGQILVEINTLAKGLTGGEEASFSALHQEWSTLMPTIDVHLHDDLRKRYAEVSDAFTRSRTLIAHESAEEANLLQALAAIPSFIDADDLEQALSSLSEAQRAFYGWQPQVVNRQQVTERLNLLMEQHRAAAVRREEGRAAKQQENWAKRHELLFEMKGLLVAEDIKQAEARLKEIKELWRQPVDLPPADQSSDTPDLQPEFAETARLFAARLTEARKEENWQRWQNKNLKAQLIEEAEALDNESDLRQVFKRIKELQERWKSVGPAPAKEEKALWHQFQQTTERNFARCRAYFQALDEEAERNLIEKIRLRDLAVAHQESIEWQKNSDFIKDLQAQWKAIGRGPKDKEQEIFQSFRAACDHFFARRKAHHEALDQARLANLGQKEALCQQAEALADQPDPTHKLKIQELQASWKTIGPISKTQEEAIWQRFRAACNRYYDWLDSLRPENLVQKEALCVALEQLIATTGPETNFPQIAKQIVTLQRQWKEIGPAPKEQQESVWQRFKGLCDTFYKAKGEHEALVDRQRPENQAKREAFIARAKELSAATVSRESVKEIIAIQEEWQKLGPGAKESERQLQEDFKALCNTFFKERREALQEIDNIHQENLKRKEALCLRLEIMGGINPPPVTQGKSKKAGLTLAEQLKVAFETNFVLSADDARDKKKRAKEEIETIKLEWQQIGTVPREHEHGIRKRYNTALTAALKEN